MNAPGCHWQQTLLLCSWWFRPLHDTDPQIVRYEHSLTQPQSRPDCELSSAESSVTSSESDTDDTDNVDKDPHADANREATNFQVPGQNLDRTCDTAQEDDDGPEGLLQDDDDDSSSSSSS